MKNQIAVDASNSVIMDKINTRGKKAINAYISETGMTEDEVRDNLGIVFQSNDGEMYIIDSQFNRLFTFKMVQESLDVLNLKDSIKIGVEIHQCPKFLNKN